jgi:hypothetical protein
MIEFGTQDLSLVERRRRDQMRPAHSCLPLSSPGSKVADLRMRKGTNFGLGSSCQNLSGPLARVMSKLVPDQTNFRRMSKRHQLDELHEKAGDKPASKHRPRPTKCANAQMAGSSS